ncbi:acyl-CoA reductase-like NAD-dependent aldehyde dehydrogenase [Rhizobium mongolense]|uniref:Acyl-CoA reductase-like NAD-dependent aldehyde dehydrogenase n=1 Tax=Rhizobium mongolense TaxID=57676 RepID=A0A7W6WDK4_9HYPH|nr:acyl-CoA reductase-like NAD-dependent aldehyde dehydrogenase [Rhizobium mongolense]
MLDDADLDQAAAVAVRARYINVGQSCVNAKRLIIHAAVADRFVQLFCDHAARLKVGDPMQRDTNVGPMARGDLLATLHRQVEQPLSAGADLRAGGKPVEGPGYFYPPTVLDHVTPSMVAFRDETFGPVAAIVRVRDVEGAIMLANQTEFGLGAAIWTSDLKQARKLARQIDAGAVFINGMVASDPPLSLRRYQTIGLRPRTRRVRHSRIRKHQDNLDRRSRSLRSSI